MRPHFLRKTHKIIGRSPSVTGSRAVAAVSGHNGIRADYLSQKQVHDNSFFRDSRTGMMVRSYGWNSRYRQRTLGYTLSE